MRRVAACRLLITGNLERNHSWESVGRDSNYFCLIHLVRRLQLI